ncbi:MAG: chemotaxis response regulator protein-glutamate methylesterase [Pseudomonadota bacterium]
MQNLAAKGTSSATPVRVVIVDDSPSMRALLRTEIESASDLIVVGEAGDPYEARTVIKATNPDVITLDIEMPRMSGLDFLQKIMRLRPTPVIMVSSLTDAGARETIEAMALGAIDCVVKPSVHFRNSFADLPAKIRAASQAHVKAHVPQVNMNAPVARGGNYDKIIAIGASTGGVDALLTVLRRFPPDCPPTLIVQHMPKHFTASFAQRLASKCAIQVVEARDGERIHSGHAYIAPGSDTHMTLAAGPPLRIKLTEEPAESGHRPSVDTLFKSLAAHAPNVVCGLLTGMGADGAINMKLLHDMGCSTVVQNEETCTVFGMPRAALRLGACKTSLPVEELADALLKRATSTS